MFQFSWFPRTWLCVHQAVQRHAALWVSPFGHRRFITDAHSSSTLFAVYRVLLRHLTPSHSPYALVALPHVLRRNCLSRVTFFLLLSLYALVKVLFEGHPSMPIHKRLVCASPSLADLAHENGPTSAGPRTFSRHSCRLASISFAVRSIHSTCRFSSRRFVCFLFVSSTCAHYKIL